MNARQPPKPDRRLPIGTTYAHWPIDGYVDGRYRTRCPKCNHPLIKEMSQMTRQTGCKHCVRPHRGSVCL